MFRVWGMEAKITYPELCLMSVYNNEGSLESALWALEAKVVFTLFLELSVLASLFCRANIVGSFEYSISPGREIL